MTRRTIEELKEILKGASETSKVYVGTDSINSKKHTTYVTVVVLHIDGNKGCMIFPFYDRQPLYHHKRHVLITEVHKSTLLALELIDSFPASRIEVHCDINEDERFASNAVLKEARSFIMGQSLTPKFKPNALAASSAGDYLCRRDRMNSRYAS